MKPRLALILLLILIPTQVLAADQDLKNNARDQATWYGNESSCLISGPGGSGPLFGPHFPKVSDTADLAKRINDFISKTVPGSPMAGHGADLVSKGQQTDVNPAMEVADALAETSLGTAGVGRSNNNPDAIDNHGGKSFPSVLEGALGYFDLISSKYLAPPNSFTTIEQIELKYTPYGDGANDPIGKAHHMEDTMHKMLDGISTSGSPDIAPVSTCGTLSSTGGSDGPIIGRSITAMVSYDQGDPRWAKVPYGAGKADIAQSGCGATSLAMVVATLNGDTSVTPATIAQRYGNQFHGAAGTDWSLFPAAAKDYGLTETDLGTDLNAAANIIRKGGLVIISVDQGHFTGGGHLMVIRAISQDGSQFFLADPNGSGHSHDSETRGFTSDFLRGEGGLKHLFGFTK